MISVAISFSSSTSRMVWTCFSGSFVNGSFPYPVGPIPASRGQLRRRGHTRMRRILREALDCRRECRVRTPDRRNDFVRRPAAAKRLVQRHKAFAGETNDFGALLLQCELLPFRVEHVEEIGQAPVVALGRHLGGLARGLKREIKAAYALTIALIGRVGFIDLLH